MNNIVNDINLSMIKIWHSIKKKSLKEVLNWIQRI